MYSYPGMGDAWAKAMKPKPKVIRSDFSGVLYRGVPSGVEGDPYEWVCLVTDMGDGVAFLTAGTHKKLRHLKDLKAALREDGYTKAMAERNGEIREYKL